MMDLTRTTTWARLLVVLGAVLALMVALVPVTSGTAQADPPPVEAVEAAADQDDVVERDAGVFEGTAEVAKAFEFCRKDSATGLVEWERKPDSPGLGLPDPEEKKNAWWGIDTEVLSVVKGVGDLVACGFLTAMTIGDDNGNGVQLGAACGASKGWNGIGTINWTGNGGTKLVGEDKKPPPENPMGPGITQLRNIGWKVSVGGTLPVTADMVDPNDKNEKIGFLEATVQAFGPGCSEKGPLEPEKGNPKDGGPRPNQGANEFQVEGVYEAVRHHGKEENPSKKDTEEKKEPHQK